jgi:hypothetical protein
LQELFSRYASIVVQIRIEVSQKNMNLEKAASRENPLAAGSNYSLNGSCIFGCNWYYLRMGKTLLLFKRTA